MKTIPAIISSLLLCLTGEAQMTQTIRLKPIQIPPVTFSQNGLTWTYTPKPIDIAPFTITLPQSSQVVTQYVFSTVTNRYTVTNTLDLTTYYQVTNVFNVTNQFHTTNTYNLTNFFAAPFTVPVLSVTTLMGSNLSMGGATLRIVGTNLVITRP